MSAANEFYWAIVAHVPDGEPWVFFPPVICTQSRAVAHARMTAYAGDTAAVTAALETHGTSLHIDAVIASRTPLALGDCAYRLPKL